MATAEKQIISVSNKSYATGLFWQPLNNKKEPLVEIEKTAKSLIPPANSYCIKTFGATQFGLGFKELGHKEKQFVAAISLNSVLKDKPSILSCLKTEQGFWVCAVRNNLILPEDDVLYDSQEDAKAHFLKLLQLPDWSYKIAPIDWRIDGASTVLIEELFEKETYQRLTALKKQSKLTYFIFLFAFFLFLGFIYKDFLINLLVGKPEPKPQVNEQLLERYRPEKIEKPETEQPVQTQPIQPIQQPDVVLTPPPYPWESMNSVVEFASVCKKAASLYSEPIFGWNLKTVTCDKNSINVEYTRAQGDISMIMKAFDTYFKPLFSNSYLVIDDSGNSAKTTLAQPVFTQVYSQPSEDGETLKQRFMALTQRTGFTINTESGQDQITENGLTTNFSFITFTFTSKLDIMEWADLLQTLGSIEFDELIWDNNSKSWKLEGKVYEKN
ncbi:MAG: type 4b pilus protein PilO2 [Rickettsiales bacterium]|jgi:hypothetical protein|nr:type 4b pilus protein PilO2 [Rickettsiales bacterium]